MVAVLQDRLKQYPTSLEESKAAITAAANKNVKNAITVRAREQELLQDVIGWLQDEGEEDGEDEEEAVPAKKGPAAGAKKGGQPTQQECKQQ